MIEAADVAAAPGIIPEGLFISFAFKIFNSERARMREEMRTEIMAQLENNRERLENQDKAVFKKKVVLFFSDNRTLF